MFTKICLSFHKILANVTKCLSQLNCSSHYSPCMEKWINKCFMIQCEFSELLCSTQITPVELFLHAVHSGRWTMAWRGVFCPRNGNNVRLFLLKTYWFLLWNAKQKHLSRIVNYHWMILASDLEGIVSWNFVAASCPTTR